MKIRKLRNEDYNEVLKINEVLSDIEGLREEKLNSKELDLMFDNKREKYSESLVVENEEGSIVGFIYCLFSPVELNKKFIDKDLINNGLYLYCMVVKKTYQNKGLGKILWAEALKIAKKNNKSSIFLQVNSNNKKAYDWYRRIGFKEKNSYIYLENRIKE